MVVGTAFLVDIAKLDEVSASSAPTAHAPAAGSCNLRRRE
jgi:hypothetical protein